MKTSESDQKKAILDGLIELFRQNQRWLLFIGTGTSVALDKSLGMPALAEHLRQTMPQDADGWAEVRSRLARDKAWNRR